MSENKNNLKPGWKVWRFDQMATNVNVRIDNPSESGMEHYVGLEHLDAGSLKIRRWGTPDDVEATKLMFKKGDIIFGRRRAYQRKLGVADFDGICSAHAMVLRAKPEVVLPEFLPFFIQGDLFMDRAVEISVGSLSPTINWKTMAVQEFSLPPIDEQRCLVRLLMSAEAARTAAEDAAARSEKLRKSLLLETFDALQGGDTVRIAYLATDVDCRWIKARDAGEILMGRQLSPKYKTGKNTRKYLRVANVFDGFIDTSDVNEMDFKESEFATFKLQSGDVLLNEGQSRELVGRSAIFRDDVRDCCFQNTLIRFRPNADVLSEFAHYYFQYCQYTSRFIQVSKQTTSIAHLGVQRFSEMKFPLVPLDVQIAMVKALSAVVTAIPQLKKRAETASAIRNQVLMEGASR
ncbi:restriction endonuclease subunit S [Caballeronia sp. LjRoot31]|uniref:restriction endonuclease subunit S n=1 Tax=Caballeronia sp. LjRoot31 TaxID=3342324 RepID=UPI003ECF3D75